MVPLNPADHWWPDSESSRDDRIQTCTGGKERADSVLSALRALAEQAEDSDWMLVNDAALPCLHADDLSNSTDTLSEHPVGGLLAAPVADTLKLADHGVPPEVWQTVDGCRLWRSLTPQMFRFGALREAFESCLELGHGVINESSAIEFFGNIPVLVVGRPDNLKIT